MRLKERMITLRIIEPYAKSRKEWCMNCDSAEDTIRIEICSDANRGLSIVLCPKCRKELKQIIESTLTP